MPRRPHLIRQRTTYRPSTSSPRPGWYVVLLACVLLFLAPGCQTFAPQVSHFPEVHNPFPQLSRVAVAPFFNQSDEATLDARRFSKAYFSELQAVPGFEVVPLGVVEEAIIQNQVDLSTPGEACRLAKLLGVDAVVVGSVTDYSPYAPPRCGLRVEWYAANPGFHEIPPGYGLPWDTPQEEFIPQPLVYESEMALARAQLATQTPDCTACELESQGVESRSAGGQDGPTLRRSDPPTLDPPPADTLPPPAESEDGTQESTAAYHQQSEPPSDESGEDVNPWQSYEELPRPTASTPADGVTTEMIAPDGTARSIESNGTLPPHWPDASAFTPPPPGAERPPCIVHHGPVMSHTRIYHSDDPDFVEALSGWVHFHDDDRFGGWHTYLQRSDDFIRFCCHLHIAEMLSARGGASQTRVVCEWPASR